MSRFLRIHQDAAAAEAGAARLRRAGREVALRGRPGIGSLRAVSAASLRCRHRRPRSFPLPRQSIAVWLGQ